MRNAALRQAAPAKRSHVADAELIALGKQMEPLLQEWAEQTARDRADSAELEAKIEQVTGVKINDRPYSADNDPAGYWEARGEVVRQYELEHPGRYKETDNFWETFHDRFDPLAYDILSCRAQTARGLAIQARVYALAHRDVLYGPSPTPDENPDEFRGRHFIESVCAFLGIDPLPAGGRDA